MIEAYWVLCWCDPQHPYEIYRAKTPYLRDKCQQDANMLNREILSRVYWIEPASEQVLQRI
ncbi:hypothetical protein ACQ4M4_12750 [Leptolyngbya sp. AN02str]|uniref:hypothetical protein n=1 Tax=Leptolyngbya sp. AN02str TaxID=3423363 RepID=UPI003D3166CC